MSEINPLLYQFGMVLLGGAFAAGGAWLAVRVEMKFLRRDVDDNKQEIGKVEDRRIVGERLLHDRIERLSERIVNAP